MKTIYAIQVLPTNPMKPPTTEKRMLLSVIPHEYTCMLEIRLKNFVKLKS